MESAKITESDNLVWPNIKLVASERPQERDPHHDSGIAVTHGPSIPIVTEFHVPTELESSEPCSYST